MNKMRKLMEAVKLNEDSIEYRDPDGEFQVIYSFPRGYIAVGKNDAAQDISGESFDHLEDAIEHAEICLSIADDSEYDGQPSDYEEMQDYMGGDDWDHGQYDESVEVLGEDTSDGIFIGFVDESHVGMHIFPRWEATSNGSHAAEQADQIASDQYEDIVVLKFRDGKTGFGEHYRAKAGRDINAEMEKHGDKYETDPEYDDMSDNMKQLSRQGR